MSEDNALPGGFVSPRADSSDSEEPVRGIDQHEALESDSKKKKLALGRWGKVKTQVKRLAESNRQLEEVASRAARQREHIRIRYDPNQVRTEAVFSEAVSNARAVLKNYSTWAYLAYLVGLGCGYIFAPPSVQDSLTEDIIPALSEWFAFVSFLSSLALSFYLNSAYQRYSTCLAKVVSMDYCIQNTLRTASLYLERGMTVSEYQIDGDGNMIPHEKYISHHGILLKMGKHLSLAHHLIFKLISGDRKQFHWLMSTGMLDETKRSLIVDENGVMSDAAHLTALNWGLELYITAWKKKAVAWVDSMEEVSKFVHDFQREATELLLLRDNPIPFAYFVIVQLTVNLVLVVLPFTLFYSTTACVMGLFLCATGYIGFQIIISVANSLSYPFLGSRINLAVLDSLNHTLGICCTLALPASLLSPESRNTSEDIFTEEEWEEYFQLYDKVTLQQQVVTAEDHNTAMKMQKDANARAKARAKIARDSPRGKGSKDRDQRQSGKSARGSVISVADKLKDFTASLSTGEQQQSMKRRFSLQTGLVTGRSSPALTRSSSAITRGAIKEGDEGDNRDNGADDYPAGRGLSPRDSLLFSGAVNTSMNVNPRLRNQMVRSSFAKARKSIVPGFDTNEPQHLTSLPENPRGPSPELAVEEI